ncbi:MAG: phage tail protein [Kordia sp.]|nr:MAG: phage tail protein [Kordia sp.]
MEPFLAQIIMFGGNFAPRGWAFCQGQLLPISQNTALFSLLGTTYGGDGRTTFGLPDLSGRTPIHAHQGAGLAPVRLGQKGGIEQVTLTTNELPSHSHTGAIKVSNAAVDDDSPSSSASLGASEIYVTGAPNTDLAAGSVMTNNTGGNRAFGIRNPYLGINYIIALQGTFPSRS